MALLQTGEVLWFSTEIYMKITGIYITETWIDDIWKLYQVTADLNFYTNSTKEYSYKQNSYSFYDIRNNELTIQNVYIKLKTLEEFTETKDV